MIFEILRPKHSNFETKNNFKVKGDKKKNGQKYLTGASPARLGGMIKILYQDIF